MINELALYEEFWSRKSMVSSAGEYRDTMEKLAKDEISSIGDLNQSIETQTRAIETQTHALVASQAALAHTMNQSLGEVNNTIQAGFSGISNQLGYMTATMNTGFLNLENTINRMSAEVCDKLDALYNAAIRPLLVKTREYYFIATESYKGGLFDDALDYINKALAEYKTDYISWFLQGKIYAFGASKHSNVIDLDKAINAFQNAVKYNEQYTGKSNEARRMAAEIHYDLGTAQFSKSNDLLREGKKKESDEMLEKAKASFAESYKYSDNMLEALFNNARCKVIQGDYDGALSDLETLVLEDRNYCLKVYANPDFANIKEKFDNLIIKLKKAAFIPAKEDYDRLNSLITELKSLGGSTKVTVPSTFTNKLPYFDILDYSADFERDIPVLDTAILYYKAVLAKEAEDEAERERKAKERRLRQEEERQREKEREEKEAEEERKRKRWRTVKLYAVFCAVLALAISIWLFSTEAHVPDGIIFCGILSMILFVVILFTGKKIVGFICLAISIMIDLALVKGLVGEIIFDLVSVSGLDGLEDTVVLLKVLGYVIINILSNVLALKFRPYK